MWCGARLVTPVQFYTQKQMSQADVAYDMRFGADIRTKTPESGGKAGFTGALTLILCRRCLMRRTTPWQPAAKFHWVVIT